MLYDPSRPLVSLHIPKTAGTSFRSVLTEWFGPHLYTHYFDQASGNPPRHSLGPGSCVHGHFNAARGFGSADYYPECDQFITFLREPFARCVSSWGHRKRGHLRGDSGSASGQDVPEFEPWLFRKIDGQNRAAASLLVQLPGYPDPQAVQRILRTRFVGVGLTEAYESSVRGLARVLGKPVPERLEVLNVADSQAPDFSSYRALYEREFPEEYEIYETGRSLYRELESG